MKALAILLALGTGLHGQVIRTVSYNQVQLDAALDSILAPDSPQEILGDHIGLTEGPVWVKDANGGSLLFSDSAANVIYKWRPDAPSRCFWNAAGLPAAVT